MSSNISPTPFFLSLPAWIPVMCVGLSDVVLMLYLIFTFSHFVFLFEQFTLMSFQDH